MNLNDDIDPDFVHATKPGPETRLVYHSVWNGERWSEPRDKISVGSRAAGLTVAADSSYRLHLFWRGQDYSRSVSARSDSARSWPAHTSVAAGSSYHGALATAGNGYLLMAYSGRRLPSDSPKKRSRMLNAGDPEELRDQWIRRQ